MNMASMRTSQVRTLASLKICTATSLKHI